MTAANPPTKTCRQCANRAPYGTCTDPVRAGLAEHWCLTWPPERHAEACPAWDSRNTATENRA